MPPRAHPPVACKSGLLCAFEIWSTKWDHLFKAVPFLRLKVRALTTPGYVRRALASADSEASNGRAGTLGRLPASSFPQLYVKTLMYVHAFCLRP